MTERSSGSFLESLEKRLAAYGATAVAVVASAAAVPQAQAGVIVFDITDVTTPANGTIWFNPLTGQAATSFFAGANFRLMHNSSAFTVSTSLLGILRSAKAYGSVPAGAYLLQSFNLRTNAQRLNFSNIVGYGPSFGVFGYLAYYYRAGTAPPTSFGNWLGGKRGFLGLQFQDGLNTRFGWADVSVNASDLRITLHALAFEDTGNSIHIIPEPSSAVLLCLGAAGLAAYRRRKASKAA